MRLLILLATAEATVPLGCFHRTDTTSSGSDASLNADKAKLACCTDDVDWYAIGGQTDTGHHDEYLCLYDAPPSQQFVDPQLCAQRCAGAMESVETCGGGCGGCNEETQTCTTSDQVTCGSIWSLYHCEDNTDISIPWQENFPPSFPAKGDPRPLGCVIGDPDDMLESHGFESTRGANCYLTPEYAKEKCCEHARYNYFVLGGSWNQSPARTHHNEFLCLTHLPHQKHVVPEQRCDQACPGEHGHLFDGSFGRCGGGCGKCPLYPSYEEECTSTEDAKCGSYWSVYSCDEEELPWNYALEPYHHLPGDDSRRQSHIPPEEDSIEEDPEEVPHIDDMPPLEDFHYADAQVGCFVVPIDYYVHMGRCTMEVHSGMGSCQGWKYMMTGGSDMSRADNRAHHNQYQCLNELPSEDDRRPQEMCNQPCPGPGQQYKPHYGYCGGGCIECPIFPDGEAECIGKIGTEDVPDLPCGILWTAYDMDKYDPEFVLKP